MELNLVLRRYNGFVRKIDKNSLAPVIECHTFSVLNHHIPRVDYRLITDSSKLKGTLLLICIYSHEKSHKFYMP